MNFRIFLGNFSIGRCFDGDVICFYVVVIEIFLYCNFDRCFVVLDVDNVIGLEFIF